MKREPLAKLSELGEGQTIKFQYVRDGKMQDGFVARYKGKVVAYENVCRHMNIPLDEESVRIFSRDGNHFICQTHGALYDPSNGLCVRGPCEGDSLKKLPIEVEDDGIWLKGE